jgi:bifunctional non-homologous end joining protein LigD
MKARAKTKLAPGRGQPTALPLTSNSESAELTIDGKRLTVSRLSKVLYPKAGFTKGDVIDYYIRISPVLLAHLKNRPLTLKRYPDGVEGGFFYEKRCPPYRPEWVKTMPVWSERTHSEIHFCLADDLASLIWAVNLADLELHTSLSRGKGVDTPTMVVFDLDPGPPANIIQCAEVALTLKGALEKAGLQSFPKTSGSKGLQVYVPLNTKTNYDETKRFAHELAEQLARTSPGKVVSKMEKRLRQGKVFIDWSQNDRHKTTVCVYSLRAKDRPSVSAPVTWDEVASLVKKQEPDSFHFESRDVLERVEKHGDLFEPVLKVKQKLSHRA